MMYRNFSIDEEAGTSSLKWETLQWRTAKQTLSDILLKILVLSFQNYTWDQLRSAQA